MLFKNICENTCGWKSVLKCVKCCLKTENGCLKTQTKHPRNLWKIIWVFVYCLRKLLIVLKLGLWVCMWVCVWERFYFMFMVVRFVNIFCNNLCFVFKVWLRVIVIYIANSRFWLVLFMDVVGLNLAKSC